jgi:hypothetical protein
MTNIQDTIGVIRDHRWVRAKEQKRRIEESGARIIVELDGQGKAARKVTLDELARLTREGTVLKVTHAFFLADPKARRKRGGTKANFDATLKLLTEKRGGIVMDLETGLTTEQPEHRKALLALSYAHIARSNQGLLSAVNGGRSQGRPKAWTDPAERQIVWEEWHSTLHTTNGEAAAAAGKKIGRPISENAMWKIVREEREKRGIKGKGASGRRPNVKALQVASDGLKRLGHIYFLKNGRRGLVKIGYSASYRMRMSTIQLSTPDDLKLIALIPGDRDTERELHGRFGKHYVRGEWFRLEGALAKYVGALPKPPKR